jgi:regulator of protease activity HflC (stomatin/prohibitin superfamily)
MMLELLQAVTGIFVVVYDGQHALKFTLGRARGVVGPGVHFKWPIVQKFEVRDTRHTTLDLRPQVIQLADDLIYEVDTKVVYQIVDPLKAIIEIDNLVEGLQNQVVVEVQRVLRTKNRESVHDTDALTREITDALRSLEDSWGVSILRFGFSNLSPSPATLEITQLELLTRERLALYHELRRDGLSTEAAVALLAGAVVSLGADPPAPGPREQEAETAALLREVQAFEQTRSAAEPPDTEL